MTCFQFKFLLMIRCFTYIDLIHLIWTCWMSEIEIRFVCFTNESYSKIVFTSLVDNRIEGSWHEMIIIIERKFVLIVIIYDLLKDLTIKYKNSFFYLLINFVTILKEKFKFIILFLKQKQHFIRADRSKYIM